MIQIDSLALFGDYLHKEIDKIDRNIIHISNEIRVETEGE